MAKVKPIALVGPAAFYIGLLIALVAAFAVDPSGKLYLGLAVLGVIVGLLNITAREVAPFLFASIAFILAAFGMYMLTTTSFTMAGITPPEILTKELLRLAANLSVFIGAGAMLISLRAIYGLAKAR
jgi:hypothetical protein